MEKLVECWPGGALFTGNLLLLFGNALPVLTAPGTFVSRQPRDQPKRSEYMRSISNRQQGL